MINESDLNEIPNEILANKGIDPIAFKETFGPLIKYIIFKSDKIDVTGNYENFGEEIYNIPYSIRMTDHLFESLNDLPMEFKSEIQRLISLYIFVNTVVKSKKQFVLPIYRLLYNRNGELRLKGPVTSYLSKIFIGEKLDNETLVECSKWDTIMRANESIVEKEELSKRGRRKGKIEAHFINELRRILRLTHDYEYMSRLQMITGFLRENYNSVFNELPVSDESVRKVLQ